MSSFNHNKSFALFLVVLLGVVLLFAIYKFLSVFVGAMILFTLFFPLYAKFKKRFSSSFSAVSVIIISILIVVIPLFLIGTLAVQEIVQVNKNQDVLVDVLQESISSLDAKIPQISLERKIEEVVQNAGTYTEKLLKSSVQNFTQFVLGAAMMYILLYFMLVEHSLWKKNFYAFLPFRQENTKKIVEEFFSVTKSSIISTGIIAVVQGFLVGISFWIVGISSPLVWGLVATLLSFFPLIGAPLVWIPACVYLVLSGFTVQGIGLFLFSAIIISSIDNVLRPILNKKFGDIHPLTSFLGVFFGLYLFGVIGIFLGPLVISYFFLAIRFYNEEYV